MKIFVTGAEGFIGRAFCEAALAHGHDLLGLSRNPVVSPVARLKTVRGTLEHLPWSEIKHFAPDAALHLAWMVKPGICLQSPENALHAAWSADLFEGLAQCGVKHIAAAGSALEYAPSLEPLREDAPLTTSPVPYAAAKMEVCRQLETIATQHECLWTWFRLFFVYGEHEHPSRLIPVLRTRLASGQSTALKTPDSVKDFVHVAEAASAMLHALETRITGVLNVGTGTGVRIADLANKVAHIAGASTSLISATPDATPDPLPVAIADITKLRSMGWEPRISLDDGLRMLAQPDKHPITTQTQVRCNDAAASNEATDID